MYSGLGDTLTKEGLLLLPCCCCVSRQRQTARGEEGRRGQGEERRRTEWHQLRDGRDLEGREDGRWRTRRRWKEAEGIKPEEERIGDCGGEKKREAGRIGEKMGQGSRITLYISCTCVPCFFI